MIGDTFPDPWLLIADADETLLGDDVALRSLWASCQAAGVWIVVNSSRPIDSVEPDIPAWLDPLGIIGAMGTEIVLDGTYVESWPVRFGSWDRSLAHRALAAEGFEPHHDEFQAEFKVSFAVPPSGLERARTAIESTSLPCRIIESGESDFDVIPRGAGKRAAAEFVAFRLSATPDRVATAGDSLNDLDMLSFGHGIVVGNASRDLLARAASLGISPTSAHRARGVLEGLRHLGAVA